MKKKPPYITNHSFSYLTEQNTEKIWKGGTAVKIPFQKCFPKYKLF